MTSKSGRYIHVIVYRAFNMDHTVRKVFKEKYTLFGIVQYLEKRHGNTATLISFCNEDGEQVNPDYKPFRINTQLSESLTKNK